MKPKVEQRNLKAFGKHLADLRREHGLTQEVLAERSGIAAHSIAYIEQGRRFPKHLTTFHKLAKAMGIPTAELLKDLKQNI
jgi:transcriptional regulator with XRE-family HTH domain